MAKKYFVAFMGTDAEGQMFVGNRDVVMDIKDFESITEIQDGIRNMTGLDNLAIISIINYENL